MEGKHGAAYIGAARKTGATAYLAELPHAFSLEVVLAGLCDGHQGVHICCCEAGPLAARHDAAHNVPDAHAGGHVIAPVLSHL